jgi:hypothetical protein
VADPRSDIIRNLGTLGVGRALGVDPEDPRDRAREAGERGVERELFPDPRPFRPGYSPTSRRQRRYRRMQRG